MVRSRQSAWWGIKWWLINLLLSWSSNWELYETPSSQPAQPTVVQHKTLIHTCTHTFSNMQIYMQPPNVASHQLGCAHPQTQMHTHTHTRSLWSVLYSEWAGLPLQWPVLEIYWSMEMQRCVLASIYLFICYLSLRIWSIKYNILDFDSNLMHVNG